MAKTAAQIAYTAKLDAACERAMKDLVAEFGAERAAQMDPMMYLEFDELAVPSPVR